MKKNIILLICSLIVLAACGGKGDYNDSTYKIMIISEIPDSYQNSFGPYVKEVLQDSGLDYQNMEFEVEVFPVSPDKLTIEILNRNVDLFIVDESLRFILLDSYGLHPLLGLEENIPSRIYYEELILEDETTGDSHLYAVPLDNDSTLVKDMGLILPSNILGAVTSTSSYPEIGVYLLSEFQ